MPAPSFKHLPPQAILRVRDLQASLAFYCDGLGFAPGGAHPQTSAALVEGPTGATLLLAGPTGDTAPWADSARPSAGAWVYLHRTDLPAYAAQVAARGITGEGPLEPYPGMRRFFVTDPDGYILVFWEPLPLPEQVVLELYRSGHDRLRAALEGLSEADLALPRAPGKWTIRQIVHHVVDSDLSSFEVVRLALAEPGRLIQTNPWDTDTWAAGLQNDRRPLEPALELFRAARAWVVSAVEQLPDALDRSVVWSSGYRASVRRLLQQVGGHALNHIGQIWETRRRHGR